MVTASISLRDVGRTFGATRALAGVDLDLKPGVTGLLGPNGAGKTTLLRLLATALPPTRGQVRVLGLDPEVPAERTGIRRQLGYLPQEVGFPRGFTAFAFVDYIALLKEWASRPRGTRKCAACSAWWGCPASAQSGSGPCPAGSAPGRAGPGAARLAAGADPGQADRRRRPGAAGDAADRAGGDRADLGRGAVHPPDRGRRGPVRAGDRAGPRPGPLRRLGHRPDRPGGRPGLAGRRAGPGRERLLADRHRPVPQRRRLRPGRCRARRPSLEDAYLLLRGGSPEPETAGEVAS